jgi:hypothetical protein
VAFGVFFFFGLQYQAGQALDGGYSVCCIFNLYSFFIQ